MISVSVILSLLVEAVKMGRSAQVCAQCTYNMSVSVFIHQVCVSTSSFAVV